MSLKAELFLLREAWQIFCQYDADTRRDAIVRNLRNALLMGGVLALGVWVFQMFDGPAELVNLFLGLLGLMTVVTFFAGLMFEPSVLAMEARILRARYGDATRRAL